MMNIRLLCAALGIIMLTACQPDFNPNNYDYYGGTSGRVKQGVIEDIRYNVKVRKNTDVGTIAGGFVGSVVGSNIGGSDQVMNVIGTVGGAVAGGVAGKAVESVVSDTQATLYIVRLKHSGHLLSVIQKPTVSLRKGDHVYVINAGGRLRLALDENYYHADKKGHNKR